MRVITKQESYIEDGYIRNVVTEEEFSEDSPYKSIITSEYIDGEQIRETVEYELIEIETYEEMNIDLRQRQGRKLKVRWTFDEFKESEIIPIDSIYEEFIKKYEMEI